ncbi:MAG: hypothetical protein II724_05035, partial [Clostridia bacterium]|nr:hypothetical protein [Clostridia bacterium]
MNRFPKRILALLITAILVWGLVPAAFAERGLTPKDIGSDYAQHGTGRLPELPHGGSSPVYNPSRDGAADLPDKYDSRDYGYITPVKNQGDHNTCWTFGTAASCEAYMIKHGVHVGENGPKADLSLNLSEYHLAYYTYTDAYDAEGMLTGDKTYFLSTHSSGDFLEAGGTGELVSYPLMRWTGLADESDVALMYSSASS